MHPARRRNKRGGEVYTVLKLLAMIGLAAVNTGYVEQGLQIANKVAALVVLVTVSYTILRLR